ncbi:hypothetical protein EV192_104149 [Actinocrispum wychmicini]|uniref:Uncharacterized protein n=1 Tax=Actinocrispum wychmicini TaxID=1213861 RepID=A0A4R2JQ59_9PSEU|nr:hypothetical protein EV192_104149 [Actinocrispum wychmicini]
MARGRFTVKSIVPPIHDPDQFRCGWVAVELVGGPHDGGRVRVRTLDGLPEDSVVVDGMTYLRRDRTGGTGAGGGGWCFDLAD